MSSFKNVNVGFIGCGNMASAIIKGIVTNGLVYNKIHVSGTQEASLGPWKALGVNTYLDNTSLVENSDIVIIAVKPNALSAVVRQINSNGKVQNKLFVSILAGVMLDTLENAFKDISGTRIIRVMPNTPLAVGTGCSGFVPGSDVTPNDIAIVEWIFSSSGDCYQITEKEMDAFCALAGSGPAYVYTIIDALADGGCKMGLAKNLALKLATQTVLGAATMVKKHSSVIKTCATGASEIELKHLGQLKDEVCSAGGTTISGLYAMERAGVRGALMDAVVAAAERSKELSKQ